MLHSSAPPRVVGNNVFGHNLGGVSIRGKTQTNDRSDPPAYWDEWKRLSGETAEDGRLT